MKPSEIRRDLLAEHARLRTAMQNARNAGARDLHDALVEVADFLREHNLREEELMRQVFPTLDAWAPIRADVMMEEHVDEEREMVDVLTDASATTDVAVAAAKLFDRILEHMTREEEVFLGEDVLSDDAFVPDSFGG